MAREPMDWIEFHLARQLLAEEFVGRPLREAKAREDAAFSAARKAAPRG